MIYAKWFVFFLGDILMWISNLFVAPILSLFTKAQPDLNEKTKQWGWLYGTWDNPPQGDSKHQREGIYPYATTGLKGYVMRVLWLYRNPCYGYQKMVGVKYNPIGAVSFKGDDRISDKYGLSGYYFAEYKLNGKVEAFEFYGIYPYSKTKCFRIRVGWKIMTDKFKKYGFATFVDTATPFKTFGRKTR